jgi:hypothetical protein
VVAVSAEESGGAVSFPTKTATRRGRGERHVVPDGFNLHAETDTAMGGGQVGGRHRQVGLVSASTPLTGGPHYNFF